MYKKSPLYERRAWRRRSSLTLASQPLCIECLRKGIVEPAVVCDHIEPHHGDANKFWNSKTQGLCRACHAIKTNKEQGYKSKVTIGLDGWPIVD
jgi:5-methylcytosine-specific restriction endonuclease McrA